MTTSCYQTFPLLTPHTVWSKYISEALRDTTLFIGLGQRSRKVIQMHIAELFFVLFTLWKGLAPVLGTTGWNYIIVYEVIKATTELISYWIIILTAPIHRTFPIPLSYLKRLPTFFLPRGNSAVDLFPPFFLFKFQKNICKHPPCSK